MRVETDARFVVHHGDNMAILPTLADCSVDAIVTDPPAGIAFMGAAWDRDKGGRDAWIAWLSEVMGQCLRVLKPGGHALVWAIPRTSHWTGMAIENAGFQIRDRIAHCFGSGFPKSADVSKAIDRAAGAIRGKEKCGGLGSANSFADDEWTQKNAGWRIVDAPITEAARQWQGWGTALKPAIEDWWLARKPLVGNVAANVIRFGTGALNIDASRIMTEGQAHDALVYRRLFSLGSSSCILSHAASRLRGSLLHIASVLRSYSTDSKVSLRDAGGQDDSLLDHELCEILVIRLFPNGVWCGGSMWSIPDSLVGCQLCRHCGDEHIRRLRAAGQDGIASLADALERICTGQFSPGHSRYCQCSDHLSSSGDALLAWSLAFLYGEHNRLYSLPPENQGRWPANLIHSGEPEVLAAFPQSASGSGGRSAEATAQGFSTVGCGPKEIGEFTPYADAGTGSAARFFMQCPPDDGSLFPDDANPTPPNPRGGGFRDEGAIKGNVDFKQGSRATLPVIRDDTGGPASYFMQCPPDEATSLYYTPKASRADRDKGNTHSTVKPIALMRYLCRLITPPDGVVLDPFAGSGSSGQAAMFEGFRFIGIEQDSGHVDLARHRVGLAARNGWQQGLDLGRSA